jgi:hypothetical protein
VTAAAREPDFTCPLCRLPSWNPNDARHRYCTACGFVDDPVDKQGNPRRPAASREMTGADWAALAGALSVHAAALRQVHDHYRDRWPGADKLERAVADLQRMAGAAQTTARLLPDP